MEINQQSNFKLVTVNMPQENKKEYFIIDFDSDEEEETANFIWPSLPSCWKDKKFFCIHSNCRSCDCTEMKPSENTDETTILIWGDEGYETYEDSKNKKEEESVNQCHFSLGSHKCKNENHIDLEQFENYTSPRPTWPHSCYCSFDDNLKKKLLKLCNIFNLKCTCTDTETCKLCAFMNLGENAYLIISDYERIALAHLELLFPFLDLEKKTKKHH